MKINSAILPLSLAILGVARREQVQSHHHHHHRASDLEGSVGPAQITCTVPQIGAEQDSTPNIMAAFNKCKKNGKIILNGDYLLKTLIYTPRLKNVEIELTGTINYWDNIDAWSKPTRKTHGSGSYELYFQNATTFFYLQGENIYLHGNSSAKVGKGSTINGNGQVWWEKFAADKKAGSPRASETFDFARPVLLTIGEAKNVKIEHINFLNGPFWNLFIMGSKNVTATNIEVVAVSNSSALPYNSDGVSIYQSTYVTVLDWDVNNSDDCCTLKGNSFNIEVGRMRCNGSHAVSIGSLGQYKGVTDIVKNVWIHDITISFASAGSRIKSWPDNIDSETDAGGGMGLVNNVTFENILNIAVDQPIVITSCYAHDAEYCAAHPSKVEISDVHFINVTGTASGKHKDVVATLDCSSECTDITATRTDLTTPTSKKPVFICHNVKSEDKVSFSSVWVFPIKKCAHDHSFIFSTSAA
ncbi:BQ2448_3341 [Microbotryum intermedium]|uniref:galacturonan 1,4-alpha-galacturonidase n=1 Tax=Microbotryum intermedium TaxID=269621 RepID=A0A238FCT2_9BASI|nr:BQ2448_3341 [Microbotryum intermedium]